MWTFLLDIASATRLYGNRREPWRVDPLTRKVFVHSLAALLEPDEAEWVRRVFAPENGQVGGRDLSAHGQAVYALLTAPNVEAAETALQHMPVSMRERLDELSPMRYLPVT